MLAGWSASSLPFSGEPERQHLYHGGIEARGPWRAATDQRTAQLERLSKPSRFPAGTVMAAERCFVVGRVRGRDPHLLPLYFNVLPR